MAWPWLVLPYLATGPSAVSGNQITVPRAYHCNVLRAQAPHPSMATLSGHCLHPSPGHCRYPSPGHCIYSSPGHCRYPSPGHCRYPSPSHCIWPFTRPLHLPFTKLTIRPLPLPFTKLSGLYPSPNYPVSTLQQILCRLPACVSLKTIRQFRSWAGRHWLLGMWPESFKLATH